MVSVLLFKLLKQNYQHNKVNPKLNLLQKILTYFHHKIQLNDQKLINSKVKIQLYLCEKLKIFKKINIKILKNFKW